MNILWYLKKVSRSQYNQHPNNQTEFDQAQIQTATLAEEVLESISNGQPASHVDVSRISEHFTTAISNENLTG